MGAWPGKYVIGLTGNIATGKSIVRKMLGHLGAYGIDADDLSHRAMAKGGPAYQPIVDYFGKWVLGADGQIDRARLGRLAFSDPVNMQQLEQIIHPFVRQAVDVLARRAPQKVIVIEAIKLLESPLRAGCDSIWVTTSPEEVQVSRLMQKRGLIREEALVRIRAQGSQADKAKAAHVLIKNVGSVEDIWKQVARAWKSVSAEEPEAEAAPKPASAELSVQRARPKQAEAIATLITKLSAGQRKMSRDDVMNAFGDKAFMALLQGNTMVGVVGFQVDNLVTRVLDVYLAPHLNPEAVIPLLVQHVEEASKELQSEAALLFLAPGLARSQSLWTGLGYEPRTLETLSVRAWQEAARESYVSGTVMLFKQLRKDRVLRPI